MTIRKPTMSAASFLAHLKRLGFTPDGADDANMSAAARFLGIGRSTLYRFSDGSFPVPEAISKLLQVMVKYRVKPDRL